MNVTETKHIFVGYEYWQHDEVYQEFQRGATIVCLDFLLGWELTKKNVPFISLRDIVDFKKGEERWWVLSHELAREWYRLPAMKFFEYRGIRIAEAPEPIMQGYLARLFYYVWIYSALKERYSSVRFTIPAPVLKSDADAYCLTTFIAFVVIDAARMVGLEVTVSGTPQTREVEAVYTFPRPSLKSFFLRVYNFFIGLAPRRGLKIYASEYWTHLAPVTPFLKDTELLLMESRGLSRIPWRLILKHRIRIRYQNGEVGGAEDLALKRIGGQFAREWEVAQKDVATYLRGIRQDLDWSPVLEACEYLIHYAPRVIADINALRGIMTKEKPDIVLQMASVGGPKHYFFLMAKVAKELGIPSAELQHATATIDPRSVYMRIETDYLLTYGADVNLWHERLGHAPNRLISVGSPRFDSYVNEHAKGLEKGKVLFQELGLDPLRPVLLAAVPNSASCVCMCTPDSFGLAEFFAVMRNVQTQNPGLQLLFKFRGPNHVGVWRDYIQELFKTDYAITSSADIFSLLCASDATVCNSSTVLYEAVLAKNPLILYPWKSFDTYHAQVFAPTIPLLYTALDAVDTLSRIFKDASYRDELMARQKRFLEGYSFDGKSSQRVAELLGAIAKKGRG